MSQKVQIELLSRYSDSESLVIEDQAEQWAALESPLRPGRPLVEPLRPEYVELLRRAPERLRDK